MTPQNTTSTKLRCLVVDDEPLAAKLISTYVERTPFLELVAEVYTAEDAIAHLRGSDIDLVFLDIHIPRLSGLELARLVPERTRIVFTTAYSDHAVEGFRVNALDYLLKPVSYEEFLEAASRGLRHVAKPETVSVVETRPANREFLLVKSEYRLLRIPLDDILYLEGLKDYVKIFLASDSKPVLSLMSMKAVAEELPQPAFMRVHRSFIVNVDKVRVLERNSVIIGGRCIPVSDSYRPDFMEIIMGNRHD
ncbi:MAG: response regulator transcription factor [Bacteroidales bacterium]|nr:response regulator transcription factor [Bacteroidales bacterium]